MKLSDKIWVCRKKAGLSQEALAERIGVSRQAISKWETGEAAPEITKLPLLARTFGVTADWLLDDSAEPEEDVPEAAAQEAAEDFSSVDPVGATTDRPSSEPAPAYPEWVENLPGFLGRMLKKYGWIFGLRIAISGAVFTAMGFVAKAIFGSMSNMASDGFDPFGGMFPANESAMIFYDNAGNVIDPASFGLDASSFVTSGDPFGFSNFSISSSMPEPFAIFCNFIIGVGLVLLIGGAVLAWYLKKKGQESL